MKYALGLLLVAGIVIATRKPTPKRSGGLTPPPNTDPVLVDLNNAAE